MGAARGDARVGSARVGSARVGSCEGRLDRRRGRSHKGSPCRSPSRSRDRSRPDRDRTVRHPLVRARLYRRPDLRLAVWPRLIADASLWRVPPGDPVVVRRPHRLGGVRHHPRRAARPRPVLRPGLLPRRTRSRSCRSGRAAWRSMAGCSARASRSSCSPGAHRLPSCPISTSRPRGADRPLPRPPRQLHQRRAVGPRHATCPGRWSSRMRGPEPRHPSQLYEAALEGLVLFVVLHR